MTASEKPAVGSIGWFDLTVPDAPGVREFYEGVVGWTSSEVDMGGYSDYCMNAASGEAVAGVCHARGTNQGLPAQWLAYVVVADLEASLAQVTELGGDVLREPKAMGPQGRFGVIRDPAGAVLALFEPPPG